jgi:hypothetical protein
LITVPSNRPADVPRLKSNRFLVLVLVLVLISKFEDEDGTS